MSVEIEIGKAYDVSAYWKKSLYEIEMYSNEDTKQGLNLETCWRNGTFRVFVEDENDKEELQACIGEGGDIWDYESFNNVELIDTWDSCSEDFVFYGSNWTSETSDKLEDEYMVENEDDYVSAYEFLENRGFMANDTNWQIHGGVTVELVTE